MLKTELIARVCHEVNRCYCLLLGDDSIKPWNDAYDWQKESAIIGVENIIGNPNITPEQSHKCWLNTKLKDGWVYGPTKDPKKKTHPCIVEYSDLSIEQRIKDELFCSVVRSLIEIK